MSNDETVILVFDGVCVLCSRLVQLIIDNDRARIFKFAAMQGDKGATLLKQNNISVENIETFLLLSNGVPYTKSDAAFEVIRYLGWPWKVLRIFRFLPRSVTDWVYLRIARNRYTLFGKKETCLLPDDHLRGRFL